MNTNTGNIGIGILPSNDNEYESTKFQVKSDGIQTARFVNDNVIGLAINAHANHTGILSSGGKMGISGAATGIGPGNHTGVEAFGQYGDNENYGVYANGYGGKNAYGIYAVYNHNYHSGVKRGQPY